MALSGAVDLSGGEIRTGKLLILGDDVSVGGLTVDAGGVLRDFGTITQMGKLKLGTASAPSSRLSVKTGAVFDIAADVKIGSGDATGAIGIHGLFEKTAGTGTSTIVPDILNDGSIKVASGTLILAGAVTGSGIEKIKATAALDLAGAVAATQTIKFGPVTEGDLVLDDPAGSGLGFSGSIVGFDGSDRLDLASFAFSGKPKLAWSQDGGSGTLTVADGADVARITLFGQYATAGFKTAKDGGTGTVISYAATPTAEAALANPHR